MKIVGTEPDVVETVLCAGGFSCPNCPGVLRPWGHGIERDVRVGGVINRRRLRRSICRRCRSTHVLVPEDLFARRRDTAEVIGSALVAKAAGGGHRSIALSLGLPFSTVRGWLRRFGAMATRIFEHFTRWAHVIDPGRGPVEATGSAFVDALGAVGMVAQMAVRRFGPRRAWSTASVLTGGLLLCNTSAPWAPPI